MTMIARLAIRLSDVTPLVRRRIEIPLEVRLNQGQTGIQLVLDKKPNAR